MEREIKYYDYDEAVEAINEDISEIQYCSDELFDEDEIHNDYLFNYGEVLKYLPEYLKADDVSVRNAIYNDGSAIQYASDEFKNNKIFALIAITNDPCSIEYFSEEIKSDEMLALTAIRLNKYAINFISLKLLSDLKFLKEKLFWVDHSAPEEINDDVLKAVKKINKDAAVWLSSWGD